MMIISKLLPFVKVYNNSVIYYTKWMAILKHHRFIGSFSFLIPLGLLSHV